MSNFPVDSILGGVHKTDWQLYWDNGASSDYLIEFNGGLDFKFNEGEDFGYFTRETGISV